MSFRYYERQLSSGEKEVFRAMQKGLSSYERQFPVLRFDTKRLSEIFSMVKLDNPLIFHVEKLAFTHRSGASSVIVKPVYSMKKQEYETTLEIVKKRLKKILAPSVGFDFYEKEKFIHDYIVKNVRYDRLTKSYSHEVTGPLCHGIGVCEGMAKVFKLMCDETGIDSLVCTGIGVPPDVAEGKKSERHAWNIVLDGDDALGVDVTFDTSLSRQDVIRYDYFNITDEIMFRDHCDPDFPLPGCIASGKEYFTLNKMSFSTVSEIAPALKTAVKAPYRTNFRIRSSFSVDELRTAVTDIIKNDRRFSKFSSFSFNVNHAGGVVLLSFALRAPKQE